MKKKNLLLGVLIIMTHFSSYCQGKYGRLRVMMMTDYPPLDVCMSGCAADRTSDPDDVQSMVRFLLYSNEFDVEGLIASAGTNAMLAKKANILATIDKYDLVDENLRTHDPKYPTADYLRSVTFQGLGKPNINIQWGCDKQALSDIVGAGKDSEASNAIIAAADKPDTRPIYIGAWGGPREVAQAIWKVQNTRSKAELDAFIGKLRVFLIACQDASHTWLMNNFPNLFIVESKTTYFGMFGADNRTWVETNIINNHGPLCAVYPPRGIGSDGVCEGDSPSFMYLISANRDLNNPEDPTQPSWGGQYVRSGSTKHYVDGPGSTTISKWKSTFEAEFKERADWCLPNTSNTITISISSPSTNATVEQNKSITIQASATVNSGTLSKVEFYAGADLIGTDNSSPYSITWTPTTPGTYAITTKATDNSGNVKVSSAVSITVTSSTTVQTGAKPKVIVTTDLGADPDDQQSLVRFVVSCNAFDVKGIICATSCWRTGQDKANMDKYMNPLLDAYTTAYTNLKVHSSDFPTPAYLKSVSVLGNTAYGMAGVGDGKDSPGSNLIIAAVDATTADMPICVQSWGGSNNLAQALWKVQSTRSKAELDDFVKKVYCYDILGQDDAGAWIAVTFPNLLYIRATSVYNWQRSKTDTWWSTNIQSHGALGAVYPNGVWAMEGDTPAMLHALGRGLNDPSDPKQRGWGGQFLSKVANIASMDQVPKISNENKWGTYYMYGNSLGSDVFKQAIENDFQARMDWAIGSTFSSANHHPIVALNNDKTQNILKLNVLPGQTVSLSASGTTDPDGNSLSYQWSYYQTDGTYGSAISISNGTSATASITVPSNSLGKTMHFVVAVSDNGNPSLTSYRRIILTASNDGTGTPPTVSITAPANNSSATVGTAVNITATATDADGTVSKVEFYNGSTLLGSDNTSPYVFAWTPTATGSYSITAKATDNAGNTTTSSVILITVKGTRSPYNSTAATIPGTIQLEEFDLGGNGVAYKDDTPGSDVTPVVNFRTNEDVDIETCTDAGGGYNIGYATAGEWLEYTVNVQATGSYDMDLRAACSGTGRTVSLAIDGTTFANNLAIPNTAGWQTWQTVSVKNIPLTQGQKILRVTIGATDYVNLNYVQFKPSVVTSLQDHESAPITLYPNPFTHQLQIETNEPFHYQMMNMEGQIVTEGQSAGKVSVEGSFPKGMYMLKVIQGSTNKMFKIVKE